MAELPANIDHFNTMVAVIFSDLYAEFPISTDIPVEAYAERAFGSDARSLLISSRPTTYWVLETLKFLRAEGFIATGENVLRDVRLTSKALVSLNAVPDSLYKKETIGSRLSGIAAGAGTEAGRETIAQTIGAIFGAALKSMT